MLVGAFSCGTVIWLCVDECLETRLHQIVDHRFEGRVIEQVLCVVTLLQ